ncbi:MAG: hypothetical protein J0M08_12085 [Bacteroidetes bacterium]|nr:hypothetical protein [Bacteroidota bacterium]
MIKIKARIRLYSSDKGRKTPFTDGYRPLFNFVEEMKASGQITLLDRKEFYPNDEAEVEIRFVSKEYLGDDIKVGKKFVFGEGRSNLGEGVVIEILEF